MKNGLSKKPSKKRLAKSSAAQKELCPKPFRTKLVFYGKAYRTETVLAY
jgi:hypothetical protein